MHLAHCTPRRRARSPLTCRSTPARDSRGAVEHVTVQTASIPAGAPVELACPERQLAAGRLGAERRRLFFVGVALSLAAPLLPYVTGTWETFWYALATTFWPIALRAGI